LKLSDRGWLAGWGEYSGAKAGEAWPGRSVMSRDVMADRLRRGRKELNGSRFEGGWQCRRPLAVEWRRNVGGCGSRASDGTEVEDSVG
jgi:hypothetical protein